MSAIGYKRTYSGQLANFRFTPNSGHSDRAVSPLAEPTRIARIAKKVAWVAAIAVAIGDIIAVAWDWGTSSN